MNYKVSVIIPVYNAEKYLQKCVQSLLRQTLQDIQIILIDDGSKDASMTLCDTLAAQDSRILVIHKANGGVSSARNVGIQNAEGEYLGFVDSDDWVEPHMFETLYNTARQNEADVVMCDAVTEDEIGKKTPDTITQLFGDIVLTKDKFTPRLLMEMAGSVWRCIYNAQQIRRHTLEFNMELKFSEDRVFNIYAMGYANKVVYLKKALYHRLIQNKSAVHRFHSDYYEAIIAAAIATDEALKVAWGGNREYIQTYKQQYVNGAIAAINNYFYRTSTLSLLEKIACVKKVCNDQSLITAIRAQKLGGLRGRWIAEGRVFLLAIMAYVANKKYKR